MSNSGQKNKDAAGGIRTHDLQMSQIKRTVDSLKPYESGALTY